MKLRKPALPESVRAALDLRPKERVLAWADDGDGRAVVATETALHLQRTPPAYTRVGWEEIEYATYEGGVLSVTLVPELESATLRVPVGDGRELPIAIRDRVTSSVVVDRFVPLTDDAGVRIVGRRSGSGEIVWRSDLDPDLAGDAGIQRAAQSALDEVRAEVSLG